MSRSIAITKPQYISASRRCDLPRFQYRQFFDAWKAGTISYDGGYGRSYTVSLKPPDVMGYIFWSKNYSPFIKQPEFSDLIAQSNAVFHFTINDMPQLEPFVPPLSQRIDTLHALCERVGPQRALWRFDPVCKYALGSSGAVTTEKAFFKVLPLVREAGITRCYFSFMSLYNKTRRRAKEFLAFDDTEKENIARAMHSAASGLGMTLFNCCNEEVRRMVPGIKTAHCVDDSILRETDRFGIHTHLKPAPTRAGCGCFESRDIGSYSPACSHGCFYCYANPAKHEKGKL